MLLKWCITQADSDSVRIRILSTTGEKTVSVSRRDTEGERAELAQSLLLMLHEFGGGTIEVLRAAPSFSWN